MNVLILQPRRRWLVTAALVLGCGDGHDDPTQRTGDVLVTNAEDVAALAGVTRIAGDLTLRGEALSGELTLPDLTEVGGAVAALDTALSALALPALARAGDVSVAGAQLARLALPQLAEVGSLQLGAATSLSSVELDALADATEITFSPALTEATLPSLVRVDTLTTVSGGAALQSLSAPKLERCGRIAMFDAERLENLDLPALTRLDDELSIDGDGLRTLSLGALVVAKDLWLTLREGAQVDLSRLTQAGTLALFSRGSLGLDLAALQKINHLSSWQSEQSAELALRVTLPSLEVAGELTLPWVSGELSLPALTEIGRLEVQGDRLAAVRAPALTSAGSLALGGPELASVDFSALEAAGGIALERAELLACDLDTLFPVLNEPASSVLSLPEGCP